MPSSCRLSIDDFKDVKFWKSFCSHLTISEAQPLAARFSSNATFQIRDDDWNLCKELIGEDGYFAYDSFFRPEFIDQLSDCFLQLEKANIPPVFCFVFDEFWQLFSRLEPLLSDLVGDFQFSCAVWAWLVRDTNQTAFAPHRDQVRDVTVDDDEHLDYLTIWIPLTDLSHLSSNICVLPASKDPDYDEGTDQVVVEDLQDIRTLQGKRGSVFCWTTGLVHWGTRQTRFGPPRMSVGLYVQNPDSECFDPPLDLDRPFSLVERLSLIGQQIINYSREANDNELEFAQSLVDLVQSS